MTGQKPIRRATPGDAARRLALLRRMERKLLRLSAWMIHDATHLRPNRDGPKGRDRSA